MGEMVNSFSILQEPGDGFESVTLSEILDLQAVQEMMNDFYTLTSVGMAIVDLKGNVLVATGWQDICTKFHRVNPVTCQHCIESDTELSRNSGTGIYRLYKCRNNMWDMSTPITVDEKHLGNLFLGQFFFDDEIPDIELFRNQARQYGFDEDAYLEALSRVPRWSHEKVETAMRFYTRFAEQISTLGHSNLKLESAVRSRDAILESKQKSDKRLKKSQEIGLIGSWELDAVSAELHWSDEVYRIFGFKPNGFTPSYRLFLESVHPDDRTRVEEAFLKSIAENCDSFEIEHRIVQKQSGEIRFMYEKCEHVKDLKGTIVSSVGIVQDITEHKQAEEKYRYLVENSPDAILIYKAGKIVFANNRTFELIGLKQSEVIGKKIMQFVHPDYRDLVIERMKIVAEEGVVLPMLEEKFVKPNGSEIDVEVKSMPITFENEKAVQLIIRDISERKQMISKLRESELRYREMTDMLPQVVFEIDVQGKLTYVNKQALKAFGYQHYKDMLGLDTYQFHVSEERDKALKNRNLRLSNIPVNDNEYTMLRSDGSTFRAMVYTSPIAKGNRLAGLRGTVIDITERKKMEDALRESSEILQEVSRLSKLGGWGLDISTMKLTWTEEVYRIHEIDTSFEPNLEEGINFYSPEVRPLIRNAVENAIVNGEPFDLELPFVTAKGNKIWVRSRGKAEQVGGRSIRLFGVFQDITGRKLDEIALKENEEKYRLLTENASDVIWILNLPLMKFTYISPSIFQLRGLSVEEALAEDMNEALTPESVALVRKVLADNLPAFIENPGASPHYIQQLQQPRKDGSLVWIEISTKFQYNTSGEVEIIGVSRNIDDRKRMEDELRNRAAEQRNLIAEKEKFFSIIAHDLRSPFNTFLGFAQMLEEEMPTLTLDELQMIAINIRKSANRLFHLLENLLEWSKIQRGIRSFKPELFLLSDEVTASIEIVRDPADKKMIKINQHISPQLFITADIQMFDSVLRNFVYNAVKFTPRGGSITISANPLPNKTVEISVSDTGIGMSQDILDKLFSLDVETNRYGTEGELSTGLGLIICKEFVERHGGKIRVESKPDKGTTFSFTMPLSEGTAVTVVKTDITGEIAVNQVKNLKILVAEDDETSEILIEMALNTFCREVIKVKTGNEAVEACRANPDIDLVMMDIRMPVMDGYEATRQIRNFNSNVIIIAQTAHSMSGDKEKALSAGCTDYITKPINLSNLKGLIMKHFNRTNRTNI